jgi:hypothetical protein
VLAIGLISIVAIALGLLLGFLFGNRSDGTAGESPTESPSVSAAASAAPSVSASASGSASAAPSAPAPAPVVAAPEGLIPPGSAVRVLVDGLRMRESPSTEADLVEDLPLDSVLAVGFVHFRGDWGPVVEGGFEWYPVSRLADLTELPPLSDGPVSPVDGRSGWVAGGDESEDFVALLEPRCPARPVDLRTLEAMLPWEHLACFGTEPVLLEGTFGCNGCTGVFAGTFEPSWLAFPFTSAFLSVTDASRIGPFAMRFAPGGPAQPAPGTIVRATGHFDDAAARGCTVSPGEPPAPIDGRTAELYCREQFVVEILEVIGTDPDFP